MFDLLKNHSFLLKSFYVHKKYKCICAHVGESFLCNGSYIPNYLEEFS